MKTSSQTLLGIVVVLSAQGTMPGQIGSSPPDHPASTITVTTRLVILDVVVTDKQGAPVENLTKDDFIVTEDKVPQQVRTLELPGEHGLPPGEIVHSTADIAKIGDAPVNILVLDELNTRFEDNAFSRLSLQKFLAAQPGVMPPPTLLVANDKSFAVLEDYTQDRDVLEVALRHDPVQYPWRLKQNGNSGPEAIVRLAQSLNALQEIAQAATGTPGRKNIIWVGKGFPSVDLTGLAEASAKPLLDAVKRCTDMLLRARVTLYIVDPTPLSSTQYDTETPSDPATIEEETGTEPFSNAIRFSTLAPATGGRVFSARNDVHHEIAASMRDGASYYTLSYSPTTASHEPGQYRHVRVTLRNPSLTATTRDGYYTQLDSSATGAPASPDLVKAVNGEQILDVANAALSKMAYNGLTVRAGKVAPSRFSLAIADASLSWQPVDDGVMHAAISIAAVCFSAKGKVLSHTMEEKTLTSKSSAVTAKTEEIFSTPVNLPTGTARLRFVVRDSTTGRLGTVDIDNP